jgi:hypothetical protein
MQDRMKTGLFRELDINNLTLEKEKKNIWYLKKTSISKIKSRWEILKKISNISYQHNISVPINRQLK